MSQTESLPGTSKSDHAKWIGHPKPPCLYPLEDGRRCCECAHCHPTPEDMERYYAKEATVTEAKVERYAGRDSFTISYDSPFTLTVDEVWPDGDAPENPTAEDVIAVMEKSGSLRRLMSDWNLYPEAIWVDGKRANLR